MRGKTTNSHWCSPNGRYTSLHTIFSISIKEYELQQYPDTLTMPKLDDGIGGLVGKWNKSVTDENASQTT